MTLLAQSFVDELRNQTQLRRRGRALSVAELDLLVERYGFTLPDELRALIEIDAAWTLPKLQNLSFRLRPPEDWLRARPLAQSRTVWLPMTVRYGGLYPLASDTEGRLFSLDLQTQQIWSWDPSTWRLSRHWLSLHAFLQWLLVGGEIPQDASTLHAAQRFSWLDAFWAGQYEVAAGLHQRWARESQVPWSDVDVLYELLNAFVLGHENTTLLAQNTRQAASPLLRRLANTILNKPIQHPNDELPEARAMFSLAYARKLPLDARQVWLKNTLGSQYRLPRIVEALLLSTPEVANILRLSLEEKLKEIEGSNRDDLQSLYALSLACSNEHEAAVAMADILAWEWRKDPWCGTRSGEPTRICCLVDAYRIANRADRALGLLDFLLGRAPGFGPALAAQIALQLDQGETEEASRLLKRALNLAPTEPALQLCRSRLADLGEHISWAEPDWPDFLKDLAEEALRGDTAARIYALERLRAALHDRRSQGESALSLPFLLAIVEGDPNGRASALRVLAEAPFDDAIPTLEKQIYQQEEPAATLAAEALAQLDTERGVASLVALIREGIHLRIPTLLEKLLPRTQGAAVLREALVQAHTATPEATPNILRALATVPDASLVAFGVRFLHPEHGREAALAAIYLLEKLGDTRAVVPLQELLSTADPEVVQAAEEALAVLQSERRSTESPKQTFAYAAPTHLAHLLRQGSRSNAAAIAQVLASRASWETNPTRRDDLLALRAVALARAGMPRDATEIADVLAWGWRQDPMCGERSGEVERLAYLIDAYRLSNRLDRAKPLLSFLSTKTSAQGALAVEIEIDIDQENYDVANTKLRDAVLLAPGDRWLHDCALRLRKQGVFCHWVDSSWPAEVIEAAEKAFSSEEKQRVAALEALAEVLSTRRREKPYAMALTLPFLLSLLQYDTEAPARAALLAIAAHPFRAASALLECYANHNDLDMAALAITALAEIPSAESALAGLVDQERYLQSSILLAALAQGKTGGPALRGALLRAIAREGLEHPWRSPWLIRALAPSAWPEDADLAKQCLAHTQTPALREAGIALLIGSHVQDLANLLGQYLHDENPSIAQRAQDALYAATPQYF